MIKIKDKVILVDDIEKIKNLIGKTKKEILRLLSEEDLSCSEIAEYLDKDKSNIYKQIRTLRETGFVKVKREEKVNYKTRKIYGKTADLFIPLPKTFEASKSSQVSLTWDEESTARVLNILSEIGFEAEDDEVVEGKIIAFFKNMDCAVKELLEERDNFMNPSLFLLMKIKLLILFIELNSNDEVRDGFEDINYKFKD
ncbi:MAG: ArsR/SmtB family transcription factor [Thermoplasmatota archaeon]